MKDEKSIQWAINELNEARKQYDKAWNESQAASLQETQALNRLNQAQKEFDKAVGEIRTNPPRRSDWHAINAKCERTS